MRSWGHKVDLSFTFSYVRPANPKLIMMVTDVCLCTQSSAFGTLDLKATVTLKLILSYLPYQINFAACFIILPYFDFSSMQL